MITTNVNKGFIQSPGRVEVIATKLHPHRKEGERMSLSPSIAHIFIEKGYGILPEDYEIYRVKVEQERLDAAKWDAMAHKIVTKDDKPKPKRQRKTKK